MSAIEFSHHIDNHIHMFRNIEIAGCEVIPVFLPHVLDGRNSDDYVARVEPSSQGGKKMAELFLNIINEDSASSLNVQPPHSNAISDR